jgi:hypothetical protein
VKDLHILYWAQNNLVDVVPFCEQLDNVLYATHVLSYTQGGCTAWGHCIVVVALRGRRSCPAAWPWTTSSISMQYTVEVISHSLPFPDSLVCFGWCRVAICSHYVCSCQILICLVWIIFFVGCSASTGRDHGRGHGFGPPPPASSVQCFAMNKPFATRLLITPYP